MSLAKGYYGSPRWSNEVADCSMPMTFDTYSNCSFGCMYCFSQFQRALGNCKESYLAKEVKPVNVEKVKKMFLYPDEHAGQFAEYIKQRRVMQWGGTERRVRRIRKEVRKDTRTAQVLQGDQLPIMLQHEGGMVHPRQAIHGPYTRAEELELQVQHNHP